ncbi:hypothetical protein [Syntrophorhabdus aromaticivorans]|uniref:hypothetical protein n=1 Tax=Syntrophorhabdus aromaticivorans TaxID=328301 RepID=UPI0006889C6D|nr:hypothetical protein [Syntrophorhabdus aromaticivorans]
MENKGWIKLYRAIADTEFWLSEPFTRSQAWVDLLLLANHKTGHIRKRGILVAVERGQVGCSEDMLAKRWKWSRGKVRRFLAELISLSRITRSISEKTVLKNTSVSSLIYILNYDKYQANGTEDSTEDGRKTVPEQECKEGIYSPSADKSASPSCPHEKIIALFHETCPMLPRVRVWTNKRRGHLQARWREDSERQELGWWKDFFAYVARSNFLTGQVQTGDRRPFVADLPWILEPEHFVKILEGKYE